MSAEGAAAKPCLAIDFGTSNSLVGVFDDKGGRLLEIDPKSADHTMMRTLLYFPNADLCYYGAEAIEKYIEEDMTGRLFRSFKSHLPNQNYLGTVIDKRILSLETLVGIFLLELKKRSEQILGKEVERAVIGRPARYSMDPVADGFALHRMQKAAEMAGFKEVQFVPEPLAAAFDYRRQLKKDQTVMIGDFGGGTSDFTLIRMGPKTFAKEDVLAIDGTPLAGDALDSLFMRKRLSSYFGADSRYRLPLSSNVLSMPARLTQRLNHPAHIVHLKEKDTYEFIREVRKCALGPDDQKAIDRLFVLIEDQQIFPFFEKIEACKRDLSSQAQSKLDFDYPDIDIHERFSAQNFSTWAEEVRAEIFTAMDRCLASAGMTVDQVDLVCLTGGTAHVPFIRKELETRFGAEKLQTQAHFHSVIAGLVESAGFWAQGQKVV